MVMYGMSPLFLSLFATDMFTHPNTGLDLAGYLAFLALAVGGVNLFGACVLTVPDDHPVFKAADEEPGRIIDETTSLLSGSRKHDEEAHVTAVQEPNDLSLPDLLKDPYFWVLFVFTSLTIGSVSAPVFDEKMLIMDRAQTEMVQSNIGSIILSLPPSTSSEVPPEITIATQVRLLAIANTVSRLLSGPLADILSPVARYVPSGIYCFTRKRQFSRVLFLTFSAAILFLSFAWTVAAVRHQGGIWVLR